MNSGNICAIYDYFFVYMVHVHAIKMFDIGPCACKVSLELRWEQQHTSPQKNDLRKYYSGKK